MLKQIFIFLILLIITAAPAWAQYSSGSYSSSNRPWLLSKGAAAREAKRFTLQEWLENKDRRALMDMWLTINTPTDFEFVMGGSLQNYDLITESAGVETKTEQSTYNGEISAYAKFIGLTLEHTNNYKEGFSDNTGIFNLRLFGNTVQGSHITLHYGLRTRSGSNNSYRLNQPFPAVTLQLYLMKYFGIQGNYRSFTSSTEAVFGDTTADELTYGAFIEYGALRIFGDVYQERQKSILNNVETNTTRKGGRFGLKIYF